jgi:asparagine synthase (glutamine-hydrolysing)
MCGLTGFFLLDEKKENNNHVILEMLELQKHRGPDDSGAIAINTKNREIEKISLVKLKGFSESANLIFGFNRLSILDLSHNGHQPMIGNNGDVILMMNGEIYNAFDYTDSLTKKGYVFKSTTDTEVVLNLYLEYGINGMLERLNGMFAISIWDSRIEKLFLARDRFGIKPLYILQESNRIAFSSEMKSFKALPDFNFELEEQHLDEFLLFRNLVNKTLFKNIKNIEPGSYLEISESGNCSEHIYYSLETEESKQELNYIEDVLKESVKKQMISDVKLGCQLSGGVDSSLVTYFASENLEKGDLETISITFDDKLFSEEEYVDVVTKKLNLQSHKFILDPQYYFQEIEKASWHFEHPINHPNTIGIYLLSQKAKQHVTVLLSGEGADEAFSGYSRFAELSAPPYFSKNFLSKLKKNSSDIPNFLKHYTDKDNRIILASTFGSLEAAKSLKKDFDFSKAIKNRRKTLKSLSGETNLRQRKYELSTYLPDLLMRQDKMSMAHSIENRVPFLDNNVINFALSKSANELIVKHKGKNELKYPLKKLCAEKFDEDFAFRNKKGFGIPLKEFMQSKSFDEFWDKRIMPGITKRKLFNSGYISKLAKNINKTTPVQLDMLWQMLTFEIWAQQYLDK